MRSTTPRFDSPAMAIFQAGAIAKQAGKPAKANPYIKGSEFNRWWTNGWQAAERPPIRDGI